MHIQNLKLMNSNVVSLEDSWAWGLRLYWVPITFTEIALGGNVGAKLWSYASDMFIEDHKLNTWVCWVCTLSCLGPFYNTTKTNNYSQETPLTHSTTSLLSELVIFQENQAFVHTLFLQTHLPPVAQISPQPFSLLSLCSTFSLSLIMSISSPTESWRVPLTSSLNGAVPHEHSHVLHRAATSPDLFHVRRPRNTYVWYTSQSSSSRSVLTELME